MQPTIKQVVILGSGVMGSRIACHFAGIGVQVLLLDRLQPGAEESKQSKERNKLVNDALQASIKSNPSPIYSSAFTKNIRTGNFTDDMPQIANADWIIEVVVERLDIKKTIYDQVEQYRSGKDKVFAFFVGQVMKEMQGKANPAEVNKMLKAKLQH